MIFFISLGSDAPRMSSVFLMPDPKGNMCSFCDESFDSKKTRNDHILELHGTLQEDKVKVACNVCKQVCSNLSKLHRHALTHTDKRDYACPHCEKCFKYHDDMLKHGRRVHPREYYGSVNRENTAACSFCNKLLNAKSDKIKHALKQHGRLAGKGRIQCRICKKIFLTGNLFVNHGYQHSKSGAGNKTGTKQKSTASKSDVNLHGTIQCQKCGVKFQTVATYKEHKTLNRCKAMTFPCNICEKVFYLIGSRDRHRSVFHPSVPGVSSIGTKRNPFGGKRILKCEQCDKTLSTYRQYQRHKATHSELRPFVCALCDKAFKIKAYLHDHIKTKSHLQKVEENNGVDIQIEGAESKCKSCANVYPTYLELFEHTCKEHAEERPFKCEKCWRNYKSKNKLLRHIMSFHDKIDRETKKPKQTEFDCPHCEKTFKRKATLDDHINYHITSRPFLCSECGASFKYRQSYSRHLKDMHTNTGQHPCEHCGKVFKRKTNLVQHLNSKMHNGPGGYVSKKRKDTTTIPASPNKRSRLKKMDVTFRSMEDMLTGGRTVNDHHLTTIDVPEGATIVYQTDDGSFHAPDSASTSSSVPGGNSLSVAYNPNTSSTLGHQEPPVFNQPQFISSLFLHTAAHTGMASNYVTPEEQQQQHIGMHHGREAFPHAYYQHQAGSGQNSHHSHHHSHH